MIDFEKIFTSAVKEVTRNKISEEREEQRKQKELEENRAESEKHAEPIYAFIEELKMHLPPEVTEKGTGYKTVSRIGVEKISYGEKTESTDASALNLFIGSEEITTSVRGEPSIKKHFLALFSITPEGRIDAYWDEERKNSINDPVFLGMSDQCLPDIFKEIFIKAIEENSIVVPSKLAAEARKKAKQGLAPR